jgi:hypothetical protein
MMQDMLQFDLRKMLQSSVREERDAVARQVDALRAYLLVTLKKLEFTQGIVSEKLRAMTELMELDRPINVDDVLTGKGSPPYQLQRIVIELYCFLRDVLDASPRQSMRVNLMFVMHGQNGQEYLRTVAFENDQHKRPRCASDEYQAFFKRDSESFASYTWRNCTMGVQVMQDAQAELDKGERSRFKILHARQHESIKSLLCVPLFDSYARSPEFCGLICVDTDESGFFVEDKGGMYKDLLGPFELRIIFEWRRFGYEYLRLKSLRGDNVK